MNWLASRLVANGVLGPRSQRGLGLASIDDSKMSEDLGAQIESEIELLLLDSGSTLHLES